MKRINFLIDDNLHERFLKFVKDKRDTMSRLLIEYIKEVLKEDETIE